VAVLELLDQPVDDALVPVVATEVVVAARGFDLDDPVTYLEKGHVEGAATEVEHQDDLVVALVEPVGQRGRGRLVDDAQHVEAGDLAGLLRSLTLGVLEVGGDSDDRVSHRLAEEGLGVTLELLQNESADLLRGEVLAVELLLPVGAHVALDGADRAVDVGDGLTLRDLADEHLAVLGERDDGRRRPRAFGVRDDGGLATFEDGYDAVRRAEVNANRACHVLVLRKV